MSDTHLLTSRDDRGRRNIGEHAVDEGPKLRVGNRCRGEVALPGGVPRRRRLVVRHQLVVLLLVVLVAAEQDADLVGELATRRVSNSVLRIGLTGRSAADARSLVDHLSLVHTDIVINASHSTLARDLAAVNAADNELRVDLGLSAAK